MVRQLHLRTSNVLKLIAIDTHYLKQYEIMNRNEQELHKDVKRVAIALEQLVKLMTKMIKENG